MHALAQHQRNATLPARDQHANACGRAHIGGRWNEERGVYASQRCEDGIAEYAQVMLHAARDKLAWSTTGFGMGVGGEGAPEVLARIPWDGGLGGAFPPAASSGARSVRLMRAQSVRLMRAQSVRLMRALSRFVRIKSRHFLRCSRYLGPASPPLPLHPDTPPPLSPLLRHFAALPPPRCTLLLPPAPAQKPPLPPLLLIFGSRSSPFAPAP
ncbi:hypothetical protein B0H14DRAFT_3535394 [Mycena olivaceomarginata]|nr:hypothetical protein B0H14DRAFT_3535394 [Mycena olivaceomarginata]